MDKEPVEPVEPEVVADPIGAANQARDALESIKSLFDTLVPPTSVVVTDIFGGEHKLTKLPARAQILVMRQMDALAEMDVAPEVRQALTGQSGMQAALLALVRAAAREEVLNALASAFQSAHPEAVAKAKASAPGKVKDAADLFGVEEMAAGLVPFLLGLLQRMVGLFGEMLSPTDP